MATMGMIGRCVKLACADFICMICVCEDVREPGGVGTGVASWRALSVDDDNSGKANMTLSLGWFWLVLPDFRVLIIVVSTLRYSCSIARLICFCSSSGKSSQSGKTQRS